MLVEWVLSLVNPAPLRLRRLGYVRQSGLLHARSRRCRAAWAPHLTRARGVIIGAAEATVRRSSAVVLGSGLLDDVPLDALADLFNRVILVDAVHPWPARLAARRHRNVALVTAEISAGLTDPGLSEICTAADLIVSANLLSQLPIVPIEAYEARGREAPPELGTQLIETHLAALDRLAAGTERVCLITDTVQREEDRTGRVTNSLDLMFGVSLPAPTQAWDWEIAPFGEIGRRHRLIHRVHAYPDWRAARV
ncbi:hypothetical protein MKK67_04165 [Methylobacterium sp. J-072]|uniref:hypothetical protein n=1 Tax=Methylobacterium sp. J-072 TaxID=2836651 RepID=UPI001FBA0DCD|nr:hypothetical protein [Methylobacterium sp. J-072]MCJ2091706.1 hypothetical protein [Methylobacterium sp. J-072]